MNCVNFGLTRTPCAVRFTRKCWRRQGELMREVDEKTAESSLREARAWLGLLDGVDYIQHSRRVLVAARKLAER